MTKFVPDGPAALRILMTKFVPDGPAAIRILTTEEGTDVKISRCFAGRGLALLAIALLFGPVACAGGETAVDSAGSAVDDAPPDIDIAGANEPRGLRINGPGAQPGYTLYMPILSDTTYLIDNDGMVVHSWVADYAPQGGAYLLDNGNLLRPAREPEVDRFSGGGQGGACRNSPGTVSWCGISHSPATSICRITTSRCFPTATSWPLLGSTRAPRRCRQRAAIRA